MKFGLSFLLWVLEAQLRSYPRSLSLAQKENETAVHEKHIPASAVLTASTSNMFQISESSWLLATVPVPRSVLSRSREDLVVKRLNYFTGLIGRTEGAGLLAFGETSVFPAVLMFMILARPQLSLKKINNMNWKTARNFPVSRHLSVPVANPERQF